MDARFPDRSRFDTRAPTGAWTSAVLFLPKSRELTDYLLASLAARLPGGELFLVGEKRGGIERASKQLAAYGKPRKLDSARHCQLWQVRIEQAPAEPDLHALAQRYSLPLADGEQVVSLPGCSAMAAWIAAARCCWGNCKPCPAAICWTSAAVPGYSGRSSRRYPASRLSLLDVDAFAVESSRLTLAANGLDGEVIAADGIDGAPRELAAIVSNPPFHQGVHTDYQASGACCARRRAPGAGRRTAPGRQQLPEVPAVDRTPPRPLPDTRRRRRFPHLLRPSLLISAWNPVNEAFPLPARTPAARPFRGHPPGGRR